MPTVIDALLVTLGLDTKAIQKGQKDADGAFKRITTGASKMGDGVAAAADTAGDALGKVKKNAEETGDAMEKEGKKSQGALDKTGKKAEKTAGHISHSGADAAEFFTKMQKQALAFFAVLTAGKSLKAFVSDTVDAGASLGRTSRRMNMAKEDVYALQNLWNLLVGPVTLPPQPSRTCSLP